MSMTDVLFSVLLMGVLLKGLTAPAAKCVEQTASFSSLPLSHSSMQWMYAHIPDICPPRAKLLFRVISRLRDENLSKYSLNIASASDIICYKMQLSTTHFLG